MVDDNKNIEDFILLGYIPKKGRTVEKNLLIDGHRACGAVVFMLILYFALMYFGFEIGFTRDELIKVLLTNAGIVILAPLAVIVTIFHIAKLQLRNVRYNADAYRKKYARVAIGGSGSYFVGLLIARRLFPNMSVDAVMVVFALVVVMLALLFVAAASISYYRVHLIKKHCPHLRDTDGMDDSLP